VKNIPENDCFVSYTKEERKEKREKSKIAVRHENIPCPPPYNSTDIQSIILYG